MKSRYALLVSLVFTISCSKELSKFESKQGKYSCKTNVVIDCVSCTPSYRSWDTLITIRILSALDSFTLVDSNFYYLFVKKSFATVNDSFYYSSFPNPHTIYGKFKSDSFLYSNSYFTPGYKIKSTNQCRKD